MKISEAQKSIDQWINTIGVRYFNVPTNTMVLMEEVGEFSRLVAREYGEQSFKNPADAENIKDKLADELADILFVSMCLANQMDIDLESAITRNLAKKTNRDKDRHINNQKLKP